jgi:hypothetical protein
MAKIIAICGFIGSGKDTVADYLVNVHGFRRESFANSLKDAVAAVFDWDRTLLEGRTKQAREWREQVDPWWAERLNMPNLTPRWVLQYFGTEVVRKAFHDQMWVASLENRLRNSTDDIVITDCRFVNEISIIKRLGGQVIRVHRGAEPEWYGVAVQANAGSDSAKIKLAEYNIHASETAWVGSSFDAVLDNNGSMDELYSQLEQLLKNQALGHPDATLAHLERSQSGN